MNTEKLLIAFACTFLLLIACTSKKAMNIHPDPLLVAWNEDSINSYQITMLENRNFYYAIVHEENGIRKVKSFNGTYKISADSILLSYSSVLKPPGLADHLIKEASGNYVIQFFTDNRARMFLRIQKPRHRF